MQIICNNKQIGAVSDQAISDRGLTARISGSLLGSRANCKFVINLPLALPSFGGGG